MFDLHMRGAVKRIAREIEISNRQAYNTATISRWQKIPEFDRVFGQRLAAGKPQSGEVQEAMLRALARAWGADPLDNPVR